MSTLTVLAISNGAPTSKTNRRPVAASKTPKATFFPRGKAVKAATRAPCSANPPSTDVGGGEAVGVAVATGLVAGAVTDAVAGGAVARAAVVTWEVVGVATGVCAARADPGERSVSTSTSPPTSAPPKAAIATRRVTWAPARADGASA